MTIMKFRELVQSAIAFANENDALDSNNITFICLNDIDITTRNLKHKNAEEDIITLEKYFTYNDYRKNRLLRMTYDACDVEHFIISLERVYDDTAKAKVKVMFTLD